MLAYSDMSPFPISVSQAFEVIHSSWQPPIGAFWYSSLDLVILIKIIYMLMMFGNAVWAQKLFIIVPYVLSFAGFYLVLRKHIKNKFAASFGSFIYAINPMTITIFLGGAMGWMYVHGILPFLFLLMLKISEEKSFRSRLRSACLLGILFTISLSMGGQTILFVVPFIFFVLYISLTKRNLFNFTRVFSFISIAFLIGIVLSVPVFLPMAKELLSYTSPGSVSVGDVEMNYKYEHSMDPVLSIISLQPTELDIIGWDSDPMIVIISLAIPLLAFSAVLIRRKWPDFVIFSLILAVSIIVFIYFGYLGITVPFFRYFRFLEVLPVSNAPSLLLVFPYGLLIGYLLDTLLFKEPASLKVNSFMGNRLLRIAFCIFILIIPFVINWPLLSGSMGLFTLRSEIEVTIPSEFYDITQWLNEKRLTDPYARSLWLPYSYNDVEINIKYLDRQSVVASRSLNRFVTTNFSSYSIEVLRKVFVDKKSVFAGAMLAPLSVKYIVLWRGSQQTGLPRFEYERGGVVGLVGSPDEFQKILSIQVDLSNIVSSDKYEIYENNRYIPQLSVMKNVASLVDNTGTGMDGMAEVLSLMGSLPLGVGPKMPLLLVNSTQTLITSQIQLFENETLLVTENGEYMIFFNSETSPLVFVDNIPKSLTKFEKTYLSQVYLSAGIHNLTIIEKKRPMPEPVLWWKFDEGSGNLIRDHSPNYLDGAISGDFEWVNVHGRIALEFQGKGSLELKEMRGIMNASFTVLIVVDLDQVGDNAVFRATAPDPSEFTGIAGFGGKTLLLIGCKDYQSSLKSDTQLESKTLYHIAFGRDIKRQLFLSVNGRIEKTMVDTSSDMTGYESLMVAPGMYGRVYDLRAFDVALSEEDIAYLNRGIDVLKLKPKVVVFKLQRNVSNSTSSNVEKELRPKIISTTLYRHELLLNPNGSAFIYLAEPFDKRWMAYYENGTKLEHFMAYDAMNTFLVQGNRDERIVVFFEEQNFRDGLLLFWAASWAFTLGIVLLTSYQISGRIERIIIRIKSGKKEGSPILELP